MFIITLLFTSLFSEISKLNSFSANFLQTITDETGKILPYKGSIKAVKPQFATWKYEFPVEKDVYINAEKIVIVEPELEQVIISKLDKEFNILELLNNSTKVSSSQYLATFNNTQYKLTIIDNKLQEISYKDSIDNDILISFSNIHQNKTISDKIFEFQIPKEFDIIRK